MRVFPRRAPFPKRAMQIRAGQAVALDRRPVLEQATIFRDVSASVDMTKSRVSQPVWMRPQQSRSKRDLNQISGKGRCQTTGR